MAVTPSMISTVGRPHRLKLAAHHLTWAMENLEDACRLLPEDDARPLLVALRRHNRAIHQELATLDTLARKEKRA